MRKQKLIETTRAVPISGKTYEEYVEAVADRLLAEGIPPGYVRYEAKALPATLNVRYRDKQIGEKYEIKPINYKIDKPINEMRKIADEMQKAISDGYRRTVLADERKLEAVLKENGWRKASEVAREIFEEIEEIRLRQIRKSEFFRNGSTEEMERKFYEGAEWGLRQLSHWFAELKKKYTKQE